MNGKLTNKQSVFVEEYLKDFNGTQAAIRAGYSPRSAHNQGQRMIKNDEVKALIRSRLEDIHMSANEALKLLADQARGDLGEFMDISSVGFNLKLLDDEGIRKNTRLIHKIKQKTTTFIAKKESDEDRETHEVEIELYDAQAAIRDILRIHGKFVERTEVTGKDGGPINIKGVDYRTAIANLAPGSMDNSETSGEGENSLDGS